MIRNFSRGALGAAMVSLVSLPAFALVTLVSQEARLGASYKAVLRVPHGCGTQATNLVRVQIPEGFFNAKPQPKAGWTLETVIGPYENGYDNHGTTLTEGVREIIWSGGELPNEWYDEFFFRGTFAGSLEEGDFFFPTIQECAGGEEAWIDTSGDDGVDFPAPRVKLIRGHGGH